MNLVSLLKQLHVGILYGEQMAPADSKLIPPLQTAESIERGGYGSNYRLRRHIFKDPLSPVI